MPYYKVEPLKELENIASKMRKFVDQFPDSFSFEVGSTSQPRVDVVHDEESVTVFAEIPDVTKENIKLTLEKNVLTIKGEKRKKELPDNTAFITMERQFGPFQKTVPLPFDINASSVEAKFENGVLEIRMSKVQPKKTDQINIEIK